MRAAGVAEQPEKHSRPSGANRQLDTLGSSLSNAGSSLDDISVLLCSEDAHDVLMENADVLCIAIPELEAQRGFDHRSRYHCHDVFEHTAYVVERTRPEPLVRWAALLHDVGKPNMFAMDERGKGHFKGHAWEGARMTRTIMGRLGADPMFSRQVELLVRHHDDHIVPIEHVVKRRLASMDYDPHLFEALCDLKHADALAHAPGWQKPRAELSFQLLDCLGKILREGQAYRVQDLAIKRDDVMDALAIEGVLADKIMLQALDAVIVGKIPNERRPLMEYLAQLA